MSWRLVQRWRRLARLQRDAAERLPLDDFAKRCDLHARADTNQQCADSLQRSIEIAERKARKGAA